MTATYNGQTLADGDEIEAQLAEGRMLGPSPVLDDDAIDGLVLADGWVALAVKGGPDGVRVRVRQPSERERTRRGLRASVRALREAVRAGDIADPQHTQRLLLAVVREVMGDD